MNKTRCLGCKGMFPDIEGPVHRYMESSPGCWAAFGEVLAREYSDQAYYEVHRLTVDSYAVQHPGKPSAQSIGSIAIHLIRLSLFLEHGLTEDKANDIMVKISKSGQKKNYYWLEPPTSLGKITVADVVTANSVEEHKVLVKSWAKSSWNAWKNHHHTIKSWTQPFLKEL